MNREELESLIASFHQGTITDAELAKLKMYVSRAEAQETLESIDFPELEQEVRSNHDEMFHSIQQRISILPRKRTGKRRSLWMATAAASFILACSVLMWRLTGSAESTVKWVKITAPFGERKKITLPDNSVVYLNAGSQLMYPEQYHDTARLVQLEGEAFFEVTHQKSQPFIVRTAHTATRVLGTRFNIEAYERENITRVALVEGKVETGDALHKLILSPGNMMIHENNSGRQLVLATEGDVAAWIKGELVFNGILLQEALQRIGEAYNINITIDSTLGGTYTITGHFKKEKPAHILNALLAVYGLKWRQAADVYHVYQ